MSEVERTIRVYDTIVGITGEGRRGKTWLIYPNCKIESRNNSYKGVPCIDLPAMWAAEDRERRQSA